MAVMVFKRAVFETRKKPKGALKPKPPVNVKEKEMAQVSFSDFLISFIIVQWSKPSGWSPRCSNYFKNKNFFTFLRFMSFFCIF